MKLVTFLVMLVVCGAVGYWAAGELGIRDEIAAIVRALVRFVGWLVEGIPRWAHQLAAGWRAWTAQG